MTATPNHIQGWSLDRVLGSGGFGIVELWIHKTGPKLAIKICKKDVAQLTQAQRKRWINEVDILKRLKHRNIVKGLELPFKHPDDKVALPLLCMEFCRKGDLRKVLNNVENCCGVSEKVAVTVMKDISSAVEYLHSNNITHRDLKPENIVLQDECDIIVYKLIDLGYAKELGEASISGSLVGTLNYVAPELLWKQTYSSSVDYWSLGILFYELITGTRPFLPTMQHTMSWMQSIRSKGYNDIRAYKSEGQVVFGQDIANPTNLSRCLKDKLVEWFRVALQWDPKKRGRQCGDDGTLKFTVFKLLHSILSKEIIYVFCASTYKINAYEVVDTTKIIELQYMIEKDTNISVSQQTLTDYFGKILAKNQMPLLSQIQDPILFVFKNESPLVKNIPALDIPIEVQKMLELPGTEMDCETIHDYYRIAVFFIKQEVHLYQLYIFALTIKVDLIIGRINKFDEYMTNTLTDINVLLNELFILRAKLEAGSINKDRITALNTNLDKVNNLIKATNQIKLKFNPLVEESNKLKDTVQSIDYMKDMSELYDKVCTLYKEERSHKGKRPTEMVKLIFEFLKVRETQFHVNNIPQIIEEVQKLEGKLLTLETIFDSVTAMRTVYGQEIQSIVQYIRNDMLNIFNKELLNTSNAVHKTTDVLSHTIRMNMSKEFNSAQTLNPVNPSIVTNEGIMNTESDVIYDNLVLRYTLDNLLIEMQKKLVDLLSLET